MENFIWFDHASFASTVIVLLWGIFQWRLLGNLRLLFWAVTSSVLADVISNPLRSNSINTWWVANLFVISHFAFLFILLSQDRQATFLKVLFYLCLGFSAVNFFFIQTPFEFNTYTAYATGLLMIILALRFLYLVINEAPIEKIQSLPLLWLAFGVLVYYGGTLFIYLFNNYLITHLPENHQSMWVFHDLLNITKNAFFFATIWVNYKGKTSPL